MVRGNFEALKKGEAYYEIVEERNKAHGKYGVIYSNWVGDSGKIGMDWAKKELKRLEKKHNTTLKLKTKVGR